MIDRGKNRRQKSIMVLLTLLCLTLSLYPKTQGEEESKKLFELSLEELMNVKVTVASRIEESLLEAPAAMVVITAEEIRQRGYSSLSEVLMDLPGFDISLVNGAHYVVAYQRGYRTPLTQRTLLMINGQVDNHLWTHVANISRQYPLSNVKRIEVLYGPASAVHGANAFLGAINVITEDGRESDDGDVSAKINIQAGSFNTQSLDVTAKGKKGDISFALSARVFKSDEPDLSGKWGFLSNELYGSPTIWGPLLDIEHNGKKLGTYYDPTDDYGVMGNLSYKNLKLGFIKWRMREGYGAHYPADKGQNNGRWEKSSFQVYGEYEARIFDKINSLTVLRYRESTQGGDWAEASPDWRHGMEDYSFISFTFWNSVSNSWLFRQVFEFKPVKNATIVSGFKYERKELTKAYDVPGYWGAFSSTVPATDLGPYGFGSAIGHSSDSTYQIPPPPSPEMPSVNLILTEDYGGFIEGIIDLAKLRLNGGIRYDFNSIYGDTVNPRLAAIYKMSEKGALKLIYGEAFQEPAPVMLWGGWSGRLANPYLKPEKARSVEAIALLQMGNFLHDVSLFRTHFHNVIKEEAENAGKRDVFGLEYRLRFSFNNFIPSSSPISGHVFYTYTKAKSKIVYNHETGGWEKGDADLGDIAPHKLNIGFNLPVKNEWNVFMSGNYVSEKDLYLRNPLRAQGKKLSSYFVVNTHIRYAYRQVAISLKVMNLFNRDYYHSGIETASSGDDFSRRSLGWHNSLLPQPGRSFLVSVIFDF